MSEPAEVDELRAEVETLRAQVSAETAAKRRRRRRITSWVLAVLAVIATTLALLTVWTFRTLNNTDLFVERVGGVIEDPQVAEAIGTTAATELVEAIGLQDKLAEQLPPELSVAAGPITAAATNLLAQGVTRLAQTPQVQQAFEVGLAAGHEVTIAILSGQDTEAISNEDGTVVLDLTPVINEVITQGSDFLSGVLDRDIPAPEVTSENVDAALTALETRLGVDLPADFGQVTLFESENLAAAQQGYQIARWTAILAPIAALALIGLAVAVSLRRLRTFLGILVGTALAMLLVSLAVQPLKSSVVSSVAEQGLSGAVSDSFEIVFSSLRTGIVVVVVVGVIAALLLFVTGDSRAARAGRSMAGQAPSAAARHRTAFLVGGAVVALVLLAVIPGRSWGQIGIVLLLYGAFALAVLIAPRPPDTDPAAAEPDDQAPTEPGDEPAAVTPA
jgi:hypothetical protein